MHSWGFLLSRRWVLFALTVVGLVAGTIWLGNWQFDRLTERKADNAVVRANEDKDPAPVADVLAVDREVSDADQWRLVEATGSYAAEDTVVVRYRSRGGVSGVEVGRPAGDAGRAPPSSSTGAGSRPPPTAPTAAGSPTPLRVT